MSTKQNKRTNNDIKAAFCHEDAARPVLPQWQPHISNLSDDNVENFKFKMFNAGNGGMVGKWYYGDIQIGAALKVKINSRQDDVGVAWGHETWQQHSACVGHTQGEYTGGQIPYFISYKDVICFIWLVVAWYALLWLTEED